MAVLLKLSDGTTEVDMLDTTTPEFQLLMDIWRNSDPDLDQIRRESSFAAGSALISSQPKNVNETLGLALQGVSMDGIAASVQRLVYLQRRARLYHVNPSAYRDPVYIQAQAEGESGDRFALVLDVRIQFRRSFYSIEAVEDLTLDDVQVVIEREPYWRNAPPGDTTVDSLTLESADAPSNQETPTLQHVVNQQSTVALTHIFNEDNSAGPAYSGNLLGASLPFEYFVVSGSTPAANDAVYFGSTAGPFWGLVLWIAQNTWTVTARWEYWTGAAWADASALISFNVFNFFGPFKNLVRFYNLVNWATTTVNGVSGYWVRAKLLTVTSITTVMSQELQDVYAPHSSQFRIPTGQVQGDFDAFMRAAVTNLFFKSVDFHFWMMIATKSRGLDDFYHMLNLGDQGNPAGFTTSVFGDTSFTDNLLGAAGRIALCTYTSPGSQDRVSINIANTQARSYVGKFNIFVRCQQIGGTNGEVFMNLRYVNSTTIITFESVRMRSHDEGIEMVYLGQLDIFPFRSIGGAYAGDGSFDLIIDSGADSSTPDVRFYDFVIMPADEYSVLGVTPDKEHVGSSDGVYARGLMFDSGIVKEGVLSGDVSSISGVWEQRGSNPKLVPDTEIGVYVVQGTMQTTAGIFKHPPYMGATFELIHHAQYEFLRGGDIWPLPTPT